MRKNIQVWVLVRSIPHGTPESEVLESVLFAEDYLHELMESHQVGKYQITSLPEEWGLDREKEKEYLLLTWTTTKSRLSEVKQIITEIAQDLVVYAYEVQDMHGNYIEV